MYPILGASIVALAIFLERLWSLTARKIIPLSFVDQVHKLVLDNNLPLAIQLCESNQTPIANLFANIIRRKDEPTIYIKEAIEEEGRYQAASLERYISAIAIVASIAPLLGILGTVLGMIATFQGISETGYSNPTALASGVWEALITTAFGLIVGIPALVGHHFILSRADKLILRLEKESQRLMELLKLQSQTS